MKSWQGTGKSVVGSSAHILPVLYAAAELNEGSYPAGYSIVLLWW